MDSSLRISVHSFFCSGTYDSAVPGLPTVHWLQNLLRKPGHTSRFLMITCLQGFLCGLLSANRLAIVKSRKLRKGQKQSAFLLLPSCICGKRGKAWLQRIRMDAMGVLPDKEGGTAIHGFRKSYHNCRNADHARRGAHPGREPACAAEAGKQAWAKKLRKPLQLMRRRRNVLVNDKQPEFPAAEIQEYPDKYVRITVRIIFGPFENVPDAAKRNAHGGAKVPGRL